MLSGKNIALGVTGGIAAYKAADLASRLKKAGADVRVVMTRSACQFVAPLTFESLTGHRVERDLFERPWEMGHISLAKFADVFVVAPATAICSANMPAALRTICFPPRFWPRPAQCCWPRP